MEKQATRMKSIEGAIAQLRQESAENTKAKEIDTQESLAEWMSSFKQGISNALPQYQWSVKSTAKDHKDPNNDLPYIVTAHTSFMVGQQEFFLEVSQPNRRQNYALSIVLSYASQLYGETNIVYVPLNLSSIWKLEKLPSELTAEAIATAILKAESEALTVKDIQKIEELLDEYITAKPERRKQILVDIASGIYLFCDNGFFQVGKHILYLNLDGEFPDDSGSLETVQKYITLVEPVSICPSMQPLEY